MEEDNPLGNDLMTIQWLRRLNVGNAPRGQGLVEVVVAEIYAEVVVLLLQMLAEFT
jgi:hypothetical protein